MALNIKYQILNILVFVCIGYTFKNPIGARDSEYIYIIYNSKNKKWKFILDFF